MIEDADFFRRKAFQGVQLEFRWNARDCCAAFFVAHDDSGVFQGFDGIVRVMPRHLKHFSYFKFCGKCVADAIFPRHDLMQQTAEYFFLKFIHFREVFFYIMLNCHETL